MTVLPSKIPLSATALMTMRIEGVARLSARDVSYALAVIYLALHKPASDPANYLWRLPDNGLRAALGLTRRSDIGTEQARFERLRDSSIRFGTGPALPMPTLLFKELSGGHSVPIRHKLDDLMGWIVHPALLDRFTPMNDHDDLAEIPVELLQKASHRFGLEMSLKLVAMHAAGPGVIGLTAWDEDRFTRKLPYAEMLSAFNLPDVAPSTLEQKFLKPAIADAWKAAEISVDIELRRTATLRNPKGKVRDAIIFMQLPTPSRIAAKAEEAQPERKGSWQTPPKTTKQRPPDPEQPVNVVPFRSGPPKFARMFSPRPTTAADLRKTPIEVKDGDTFEF